MKMLNGTLQLMGHMPCLRESRKLDSESMEEGEVDRLPVSDTLRNPDYNDLIYVRPNINESMLAYEFLDSASRLASTHRGKPEDDLIFHPYFLLFRHGVELLLKVAISEAANNKWKFVEPIDAKEAHVLLRAYLKDGIGHRLYKLYNFWKKYWKECEMVEELPACIEQLISVINQMDQTGQGFRYIEQSRTFEDRLSFTKLVEQNEKAVDEISNSVDFMKNHFSDYDPL